MMCRVLFSITTLLALGSVALSGQKPAPQNPASNPQATIPSSAIALIPRVALGDLMTMQMPVGSFKIVPRGDVLPAGRLQFAFEGTVLVSKLAPGSYLQTTGDVQEQYESKEHGKQVFFGKGRISIVGKFKSCEWFGRNLDMTFKGIGIVRTIAEFDKKGNTGYFWFEPSRKNALQPVMTPIVVPEVKSGPQKAIKREDYEKLLKKSGG